MRWANDYFESNDDNDDYDDYDCDGDDYDCDYDDNDCDDDDGGDDDDDGDDDYLRVSYQQQQCDIVGSRWQPSRWAKIKVIQIQKQIQIGTQI